MPYRSIGYYFPQYPVVPFLTTPAYPVYPVPHPSQQSLPYEGGSHWQVHPVQHSAFPNPLSGNVAAFHGQPQYANGGMLSRPTTERPRTFPPNTPLPFLSFSDSPPVTLKCPPDHKGGHPSQYYQQHLPKGDPPSINPSQPPPTTTVYGTSEAPKYAPPRFSQGEQQRPETLTHGGAPVFCKPPPTMVSAFKARENMNVAIRPGSKPSLRKPSPLSIVSPSIQVKAQTGQNSVSGSEGLASSNKVEDAPVPKGLSGIKYRTPGRRRLDEANQNLPILHPPTRLQDAKVTRKQVLTQKPEVNNPAPDKWNHLVSFSYEMVKEDKLVQVADDKLGPAESTRDKHDTTSLVPEAEDLKLAESSSPSITPTNDHLPSATSQVESTYVEDLNKSSSSKNTSPVPSLSPTQNADTDSKSIETPTSGSDVLGPNPPIQTTIPLPKKRVRFADPIEEVQEFERYLEFSNYMAEIEEREAKERNAALEDELRVKRVVHECRMREKFQLYLREYARIMGGPEALRYTKEDVDKLNPGLMGTLGTYAMELTFPGIRDPLLVTTPILVEPAVKEDEKLYAELGGSGWFLFAMANNFEEKTTM